MVFMMRELHGVGHTNCNKYSVIPRVHCGGTSFRQQYFSEGNDSRKSIIEMLYGPSCETAKDGPTFTVGEEQVGWGDDEFSQTCD